MFSYVLFRWRCCSQTKRAHILAHSFFLFSLSRYLFSSLLFFQASTIGCFVFVRGRCRKNGVRRWKEVTAKKMIVDYETTLDYEYSQYFEKSKKICRISDSLTRQNSICLPSGQMTQNSELTLFYQFGFRFKAETLRPKIIIESRWSISNINHSYCFCSIND